MRTTIKALLEQGYSETQIKKMLESDRVYIYTNRRNVEFSTKYLKDTCLEARKFWSIEEVREYRALTQHRGLLT